MKNVESGEKEHSFEELLSKAWLFELGRRLPPYDLFKWWGRRPTILVNSILLDAAGIPPESITDYISKRVSNQVIPLLRNLKICDPMCGGGSTCIKALFLGAKTAVCSDIDPSSIIVVGATLKSISNDCVKYVEMFKTILKELINEFRDLWFYKDFYYVHTFLTRDCYDDYCRVPRWLATKRSGGNIVKYVISEDGGISVDNSVDIRETIRLPRAKLAEVSRGVYAYAVEFYRGKNALNGERIMVSLIEDEDVKSHLVKSQERAKELVGKHNLRIPLTRETSRLSKAGVKYWEELFTPRQLLTLKRFLEKTYSRDPNALNIAIAIVGTASRTASMLAFYYQPYGKVNPGLVVKSYWLPKYPVELNPLAGSVEELRTVGRGTLITYIKKLRRTCEEFRKLRLKTSSVKLYEEDAFEFDYSKCDIVLLDPPYPGKIDYSAMTLIYRMTLNLVKKTLEKEKGRMERELNVHDMDAYTKQISAILEKILIQLREKSSVYLLLSNDEKGLEVVEAIKKRIRETGLSVDLREYYPFRAESPGELGRSSTKEIILVKISKSLSNLY